jgi:signal transduction histidine kinase
MDACATRSGDILKQIPPDATRISGLTPVLEELTASIAHEVKQPLAAIIMNGETCLRWLDGERPQIGKARAGVAAIIRSALRSSEIIGRLCALSAEFDIPRVALNLNDTLQGVVPLIEPELVRNKVSLRLDLASDLAPVLGDQVQLQQVIINLLLNGIQAMTSIIDRPRELLIRSLEHDDHQVAVVVQDNGTGIDPRHLDRLFNAFFTTKVGGTGVGLSICRSIIEAHGGRIWASRNDGHGATFHFVLPTSLLAAAESPHGHVALYGDFERGRRPRHAGK